MVKGWLAGLVRGLAPAVALAGLLVMQVPVPAQGAEVGEVSSDEVSSAADSAFDWVRQFGTAQYDDVGGMAVGSTGVYVVGRTGGWSPGQRFLRKYDFGGNQLWSHDNGTCVAVGADDRVLVGDLGSVRSFDPDGNEVWAVDINDEGYFYHATDISADSGGVYVGGSYWSKGSGDKCGHFLQKCDAADGHIVWTQRHSCGPGDTGALGICATSGGIYFAVRDSYMEVVGYPDFGYQYDFLYKYDADGNQVWVRPIGLSGGYTQDISADATGVYVSGSASDPFIRKYDTDGNEEWARLFGTEAVEMVCDMSLYSGSIYVAGWTWGVFPGQVGRGGADVFVCRYDTDGEQVWVRQLGSSSEDDTAAIAVSAAGIYVGGRTRGAMPGFSNQGLDDAYVARLAIGGILGSPGWEVMDAPADLTGAGDTSLVSVCGTSSDVLALAFSGEVIHYDGQEWDLLDAGPVLPHGESSGWVSDMWASSPSDIFVAGRAGWIWEPLGIGQAAIFHYDGDDWTTQATMAGDCAFFTDLWGSSASDVFAAGNVDAGFIEHYDGVSWGSCQTSDNTGLFLDSRIRALWGTGSSDAFAAGTGHCLEVVAIYHFDGSQWSCVHSGGASAQSLSFWCLNGIWNASSSDAFAVGSGHDVETGASRGIILHYDGSTTSAMTVGAADELTAVWGSSASDVYAVGTNGTILHYDGCSWTPMNSGTKSHLRAVWGSGPDVFAVGDNGTILHYCSDPAVTFADQNLETAIRHEIQKYSGVLRRSDLAGLTALRDSGPPIRNLGGLEYCTGLTCLDLDDNEIGDISPLSGLTSLTSLHLRCNQINDASPLSGLTNLMELDLGYNEIADISPLGSLTGLNALHLGHNQIVDISPLCRLTGLNWLYLFENRIADLSALSNLTVLGNLALWNNQVVDILPLSGLVNLRELALDCNRIVDISPLATVSGLQNLYLDGNEIADVSPLCGLTQLAGVRLCDNRIRQIPPLRGLPSLQYLQLGGNMISDVSGLCGLSGVAGLGLQENRLSDISPLSSLTGLRRLGLEGNQVSDLSPLSSLTGLECLWISENQVSDLSPLAGLVNLQVLCADNNEIADVPQLSELTSLNYLCLDGNRISDVSPLTSITGLWYLQLGGNQVSDFSPLASLPNLAILYLDHNQISQLAPVPDFPCLSCLDLSGNLISDVSPLAGLTRLPELHLDNNLISDISPLSSLTGLSRLSLDSNQISDISALSGLTGLTCLSLRHNRTADIQPLVDNPGIRAGFPWSECLVYLEDNPLSAASLDTCIPALLARGVQVFWDETPPAAPAAPEGDAGAADTPAGDAQPGGTAPAHDGLSDDGVGEPTPTPAPAEVADNAGMGGNGPAIPGDGIIEAAQPSSAGSPAAAISPEAAAVQPEDSGNCDTRTPARLWVYPMAVVGGFLGVSALASFAAWLRGRMLG